MEKSVSKPAPKDKSVEKSAGKLTIRVNAKTKRGEKEAEGKAKQKKDKARSADDPAPDEDMAETSDGEVEEIQPVLPDAQEITDSLMSTQPTTHPPALSGVDLETQAERAGEFAAALLESSCEGEDHEPPLAPKPPEDADQMTKMMHCFSVSLQAPSSLGRRRL